MFERELEQEEKTLAAERGRSPSEAASVFGGPAEPTAQAAAVQQPQVASPAAEAGSPITAVSGPEPSSSAPLQAAEAAELADDFPDEESFPEEPFEEPLRKPRLVGNGKRLRKRRPAVRALKAVAALRAAPSPEDDGDTSGVPLPEVLQRSAVSNPLPPTTPACMDTLGG